MGSAKGNKYQRVPLPRFVMRRKDVTDRLDKQHEVQEPRGDRRYGTLTPRAASASNCLAGGFVRGLKKGSYGWPDSVAACVPFG
jgi:hypothetical protein